MSRRAQEPLPPAYYSRLWYSHKRGYEAREGEHSLIRRVIDHRRHRHNDLFSRQGLWWYPALAYEDLYARGEKQEWEFVSISEEHADRIIERWRSHSLKGKGPLTLTYYAQVEDASLEHPTEIVRVWKGPGQLWWEGYTSSVQHGWRWTETWMSYHLKGNGMLIEISEEHAHEVIGRWKEKARDNGRERLHYARLWYSLTSKPVQGEREDWTPLIRRRASLSRDEALLADGSWMATEALKAWELAQGEYEYVQITAEQARKIAQNWTQRDQLSFFPEKKQK